jgi:hypothetical protein
MEGAVERWNDKPHALKEKQGCGQWEWKYVVNQTAINN